MEKLYNALLEKKLTLGSVESMTAGLFASEFTNVPGASKVFKGSIVSYSCLIKENVVGVKEETIEKFGVVSKEVALEMAENGRKLLGVDVCVSVTGNAGPTAEPGEKPVGCFYIAISAPSGSFVVEKNMSGKRNDIRNGAVLAMRDLAYLKVI